MTPPFDSKAKTAFIIACVVLLTSSIGFQWAIARLNVFLEKEPVEMRGSFTTIPRAMGSWKALQEDPVMDKAILEEIGTDKVLQRNYTITADRKTPEHLNIHLAYYTGMIDAVPHVPDRCMAAGGYSIKVQPRNDPIQIDRTGWVPDMRYGENAAADGHWMVQSTDDFKVRIPMPQGDFVLRTTEFYLDNQPNIKIFGGYFFIANNRITSTPEGVKSMAFRPSEKYAYYCKVQFTFGNKDATREQFYALVTDMLKHFLPELMRRLPDWHEVQSRDQQTDQNSTATVNTVKRS